MAEWPLQDAKNRFSAVVDAAVAGDPQRVTRRGKPAVVVLAVEEYERLRRLEKAQAPTLADLLLAIPQDDEEFERLRVTLSSQVPSSPWQNPRCIRAAMHPAWTALLLGRICPIWSLVAPCHAGASPLSVRRGVSPRTASAPANAGSRSGGPGAARRS